MNPVTMRISILFLIFMSSSSADDGDLSEINKSLMSVKEVRHYKNIKIDSGSINSLLASDAFTNLETKCSSDWNQVVDNLDAIEGEEEKKIVFWAMGKLRALEYMTFLEKLTTMYESGMLDEKLFKSALFPNGRMSKFSVENYKNARMVAVLNRVKIKTADNSLKKNISYILSGRSRKTSDNYREAHKGLIPERTTPLILLGGGAGSRDFLESETKDPKFSQASQDQRESQVIAKEKKPNRLLWIIGGVLLLGILLLLLKIFKGKSA